MQALNSGKIRMKLGIRRDTLEIVLNMNKYASKVASKSIAHQLIINNIVFCIAKTY